MVLPLVLIKPDLILVGPVLKSLPFGFQANTPAARNHLAAHFIISRGSQRRVGEIGILNRLLGNVTLFYSGSVRQVLAGFLNCRFFANTHSEGPLERAVLNTNDPLASFVPPTSCAYCEPPEPYGQRDSV